MEGVSTGVLIKKEYLRSKDKAEKWYDVSRHIHYRQKIWNIFYFSDFSHFSGVCMVCLHLKYIPTSRYYFGGSWLALNSKMKRKGSKIIISVHFPIRLWLKFLFSLCQVAAISFVCCIEILCTIPLFICRLFWCSQQGISVVGPRIEGREE